MIYFFHDRQISVKELYTLLLMLEGCKIFNGWSILAKVACVSLVVHAYGSQVFRRRLIRSDRCQRSWKFSVAAFSNSNEHYFWSIKTLLRSSKSCDWVTFRVIKYRTESNLFLFFIMSSRPEITDFVEDPEYLFHITFHSSPYV